MSSSLLFLMFQTSDAPPQIPSALGAGIGMGFMLVWLALMLVIVASFWKVFTKAGEPGWAAIVPIYNLLVLAKIAGKPSWWGIVMLVPFIGFIFFIITCMALAERFGKGAGFGLGLSFLGIIFFPILGFGDSQYR